MINIRKACSLIGGVKILICDMKWRLRWYVLNSWGLKSYFSKSSAKAKILILIIYKEVW